MLARQAVEEVMHIDRREIDGGRFRIRLNGVDPREQFRKLGAYRPEVHPHGIIVEQAPARAGLSDGCCEQRIAAAAKQIVARFPARAPARLHQRPIRDQSPDDERLSRLAKKPVELGRRIGLCLGYRRQLADRSGIGLSHSEAAGSCGRSAR
jgi:hypothetical protein